MPRKNNPIATFVMFLAVAGFGWASWHFFVEKRIQDTGVAPPPPASEIDRLRALTAEALTGDECFESVTAFNWREQSGRYRVDINIRDGCSNAAARSLARRTSDVVQRATDGRPAEVAVLILGREVWHFVP
jgi:hypothetical protein